MWCPRMLPLVCKELDVICAFMSVVYKPTILLFSHLPLSVNFYNLVLLIPALRFIPVSPWWAPCWTFWLFMIVSLSRFLFKAMLPAILYSPTIPVQGPDDWVLLTNLFYEKSKSCISVRIKRLLLGVRRTGTQNSRWMLPYSRWGTTIGSQRSEQQSRHVLWQGSWAEHVMLTIPMHLHVKAAW